MSTLKKFHTIAHKASLKTRVRVAINVLRNRPVAFRIGIEYGNVYVPETLFPEHFHMDYSIVRMVDAKGDVVPYEKLVPTEDFEKHSCDCDTYARKE